MYDSHVIIFSDASLCHSDTAPTAIAYGYGLVVVSSSVNNEDELNNLAHHQGVTTYGLQKELRKICHAQQNLCESRFI